MVLLFKPISKCVINVDKSNYDILNKMLKQWLRIKVYSKGPLIILYYRELT